MEARKIVIPTPKSEVTIRVKPDVGLVTPREILVEAKDKIVETPEKLEGSRGCAGSSLMYTSWDREPQW